MYKSAFRCCFLSRLFVSLWFPIKNNSWLFFILRDLDFADQARGSVTDWARPWRWIILTWLFAPRPACFGTWRAGLGWVLLWNTECLQQEPSRRTSVKATKKKHKRLLKEVHRTLRIHCPAETLVSSLGGVVVFIFSAFGNCVSSRATKSSQRSYSFPR